MASGSSVSLASGLRLSYADRGSSADALLLLPGPTDSWRSYRSVLDRLSPDRRVVAVSPRGHGDSAKPDTGYGVEDFASDVVPLLDALGIERAVLAGHSGSCLVARRVALDHPERVAGLVLEASPSTLRGHAGLQELVDGVISALEDPIPRDFARSFVIDTSSDGLPAAVLEELVDELLEVPARVWREMFPALLEYDDLDELERITAPTLLIWGDADALVPRAMQDELLTRIPDAELRVHAGAGHAPRFDDPSRFSDDVSTFARPLLRTRSRR